jgi:hypothetical protein
VQRYYYAGGKRVELQVDPDRVGVDSARAANAGLEAELARAQKAGTRLPGGIFVVKRSVFTKAEISRLDAAGAARTVYRVGAVTTVPMPEVRVEFGKGRLAATLAAAKSAGVAAQIDEESNERLILRPKSGSGEDALRLANFIYEKAHPTASSARLLQIAPRADVVRRG